MDCPDRGEPMELTDRTENRPLRIFVRDGLLVIEIGTKTLQGAFERSEQNNLSNENGDRAFESAVGNGCEGVEEVNFFAA